MQNHKLNRSTVIASLLFVASVVVMLVMWQWYQNQQTAKQTGESAQNAYEVMDKVQKEIDELK